MIRRKKAVKSEKLDTETAAYIKELRRLRLAEEALLKEKRESSAVSEDHSN